MRLPLSFTSDPRSAILNFIGTGADIAVNAGELRRGSPSKLAVSDVGLKESFNN
jgi:hypothetical protein